MANIVIVGANQGIGYHMAKRLLELNHSVVVLDIDISNIRQLQPRYSETLLPIVYKMSRPNVQKILYKNVQLVCLLYVVF